MTNVQFLEQPIKTHQSYNQCMFRALECENSHGLDIMYGMLMAYDKGLKTWDVVYPWHIWNVDTDNNVYDSRKAMQWVLDNQEFKTDISNPRIKLVDGSEWKDLGGLDKSMPVYINRLNKTFGSKYELIYVYNFAYDNDRKSLLDWDEIENRLSELEELV